MLEYVITYIETIVPSHAAQSQKQNFDTKVDINSALETARDKIKIICQREYRLL
jgi:hypothetical protein